MKPIKVKKSLDLRETLKREQDMLSYYSTRAQIMKEECLEKVNRIKAAIAESDKPLLDAIREAEGRATVRRITPEAICSTIKSVEKHLYRFSTKSDAIGTKVTADINQQHFPNAYKHRPESTHFTAVLTKQGWKITAIYRTTCIDRSSGCGVYLTLTDATKARMADKLSVL